MEIINMDILFVLFKAPTESMSVFSSILRNTTLRHSTTTETTLFSIYTLSDLGDLSNLIGSLSRTIQQYSPPSEWIMCELGVFSHFFRERSFRSRQNPRADFF